MDVLLAGLPQAAMAIDLGSAVACLGLEARIAMAMREARQRNRCVAAQ
jgi:hypothetical protein